MITRPKLCGHFQHETRDCTMSRFAKHCVFSDERLRISWWVPRRNTAQVNQPTIYPNIGKTTNQINQISMLRAPSTRSLTINRAQPVGSTVTSWLMRLPCSCCPARLGRPTKVGNGHGNTEIHPGLILCYWDSSFRALNLMSSFHQCWSMTVLIAPFLLLLLLQLITMSTTITITLSISITDSYYRFIPSLDHPTAEWIAPSAMTTGNAQRESRLFPLEVRTSQTPQCCACVTMY